MAFAWGWIFTGQSLVPNLTDFGRRSPAPLHQDLLDWLAVDFMEHGWSLKRLHRQMVLSDTYAMSSSATGTGDSENRFYWRMNAQRLEFVRREMGVQHTLQPSENLEKDLRDLTDGHLPEVVIDATGSSASMSGAFGLVAPGGRLVYVGISTDEIKFRHPVFHRPEGTLLCSRNAMPQDFENIIQWIEEGKIDTRPWITHRAAFEQLIEVFPSYTKPETGVIKAIVDIGL